MKSVAILGSTGIVGKTLLSELTKEESISEIRLVSRSAVAERREKGITTHQADLTDPAQSMKALEGIDTAFLTVGLPYRTEIWLRDWPRIMENTINSCKKYNTGLIFFDNVYSYGLVKGEMTEKTPLEPISKKGESRKIVDEKLFAAIAKKKIKGIIARSADFYGPGAIKSALYIANIQKLLEDKKPYFLIHPYKLHNFTYVPDAARALLILAKDKKAWNQTWHLPTAQPLKGDEFMAMINNEFGRKNEYRKIPKLMLELLGIFNKDVYNLLEIYYQFDHDYIFNSDKFKNVYKFIPTSYKKGIRKMIESFSN